MKGFQRFRGGLAAVALSVGFGMLIGVARAGQYTQNFTAFSIGTTSFGDGSSLHSSAAGPVASVQDGALKELQLTQWDVTGTRSAFLLPDLDPGVPIYGFTATWVSPVYGDFPNAAEGFSFNFGPLRSRNLIDTSTAQEFGYFTGLSLSVVTGPNNVTPGFRLFADNVKVAGPVNLNPTATWGNFSSTRHTFQVSWRWDRGMSVSLDGMALFTDVATGAFTPSAGDSFVFAARSGSQGETFRIDNLAVVSIVTPPLSGTKSIGPTGDYASLTGALADLMTRGMSAAVVFELQPAYVSTVETFPLTIGTLPTTALKPLTVRPQSGATGLSITSADATAATVDLNGAQFVTFDGRPGGVGTAKQLTLGNTDVAGVAVRFINEAGNNTLEYLALQSVNTSDGSGTVLFSTTTGANGNDGNTIDHCDLRDGTTTPANALYSIGSTGTAAQNNSGNTVSNCNVFDFYSATQDAAGVRLEAGNTGWIFTGNSFYQTARRIPNSNVRAIYLACPDGDGFVLSENFIGGSAPEAAGGSWSAEVGDFQGLWIEVGENAPSSIQGNVVRKIIWASSQGNLDLPGAWCGIYIRSGRVNAGTLAGNTIGSDSGNNSIDYTLTPTVAANGVGITQSIVHGIGSASHAGVAIANNTVGAVITRTREVQFSSSLVGIRVTDGSNTISGNLLGSLSTPKSLQADSRGARTLQTVAGIQSSSGLGASIVANSVANLHSASAAPFGPLTVRGIEISDGMNSVSDNTVRDLSSMGGRGEAMTGIRVTSTKSGQRLARNRVYSLDNRINSSTWATTVAGITIGVAAPDGDNEVSDNLVHSLANSSIVDTGESKIVGLNISSGHFNVWNNAVQVGLKPDGTGAGGVLLVQGIFDGASTAGRSFLHNTVLVAGAQTGGSLASTAFASVGNGLARDFRNNIFANARTNNGATSKHYAVQYGGTGANPIGLIADHNLLYVSGPDGVTGYYDGADRVTLADWRTATGADLASLSADPLFVNPVGTAATVDLHVQSGSPAGNAGVPIAGITTDIDGDLRSLTTPDLGADELVNAPLAGLDTAHRPPGRTAKIPVATLLANDTSELGLPLSVSAVAATSAGGVDLRLLNGVVLYVPTTGFNAPDSFTYSVSDGIRTATGTVNVVVDAAQNASTQNILAAALGAGGEMTLTAAGIPGRSYRLEHAESLIQPISWTNLGGVQTAPANGQMDFTDPVPTSPGFYRVVEN